MKYDNLNNGPEPSPRYDRWDKPKTYKDRGVKKKENKKGKRNFKNKLNDYLYSDGYTDPDIDNREKFR